MPGGGPMGGPMKRGESPQKAKDFKKTTNGELLIIAVN